jgi:quercetin 2,3-dioxygenase
MIRVRKSSERGRFDHGWLKTAHTFSFAGYYDPQHMGFSALRVMNEDHIAGGGGFPTHGHRDMEIITYVLNGELAHTDSMGNEATITAGEVQYMTAGSGVMHSEYNASKTEPVHLLQIWLEADQANREPGYVQKKFSRKEKLNALCPIATPTGEAGSMQVHQSVSLYASILESSKKVDYECTADRCQWVQVVSGELTINDTRLEAGDGTAIVDEHKLDIMAAQDAEFLLFDLPKES